MIAGEGLPRLWRRPDAERGGPAREIQARAEAVDFGALPERAETRLAGLLLSTLPLIHPARQRRDHLGYRERIVPIDQQCR